jgi:hypothetical protein
VSELKCEEGIYTEYLTLPGGATSVHEHLYSYRSKKAVSYPNSREQTASEAQGILL